MKHLVVYGSSLENQDDSYNKTLKKMFYHN